MSAVVHFLVAEGRIYIGQVISFIDTLLSLDFSKPRNSQYIPLVF